MNKGKTYLIQVPDGREVKGKLIKIEGLYYFIEFEPNYKKKVQKIARDRFESGVACFEGTDHLVLRQV